MITREELITPELATAYLATNKNNRPINNNLVKQMIRDIQSGSFALTHQGIAFDEEGNLVDGQHRLTAIVLAGKPVRMLVTRGMSRDNSFAIDKGSKRDLRDYIVFNNWFEDDPVFRDNKTTAMVRCLYRYGLTYDRNPTDAEVLKLYEAFRDEIILAFEATKGKASSGITGATRAAALAAIIYGEPAEDIALFFNVYAKGEMNGCFGCNVSAATSFSRYVLGLKARRMNIAKQKLYAMTQNAIWNFLRGTSSQPKGNVNLRYPVDEKLTSVLKIKEANS